MGVNARKIAAAMGIVAVPLVSQSANMSAAAGSPPPPMKANGTYTGKVSKANKYGPVQVQIVVKKNKIVAVNVPKYPTHSSSGPINATAIPKLKKAVLTKQSAKVSNISGASLTSKAFKQSLQSAMSQAGL